MTRSTERLVSPTIEDSMKLAKKYLGFNDVAFGNSISTSATDQFPDRFISGRTATENSEAVFVLKTLEILERFK